MACWDVMADPMRSSEAEENARQPVVLVVEDEILVRGPVAEDLREAGFTVIEAATAAEAIAVFGSGGSVDAVFSDIGMPGPMDGLGLARWVSLHHPSVCILLTSGGAHSIPEPLRESFFLKPCDSTEVASRIRILLKRGVRNPGFDGS
jgi:DNA-binding response OmpR family regulator